MLPIIRRYAKLAFRHLNLEARKDAVQGVTAIALVAYHGLYTGVRGNTER
jgi:hypothetical protein